MLGNNFKISKYFSVGCSLQKSQNRIV